MEKRREESLALIYATSWERKAYTAVDSYIK